MNHLVIRQHVQDVAKEESSPVSGTFSSHNKSQLSESQQILWEGVWTSSGKLQYSRVMDGPQHVMDSTESVAAATGLDGIALLTGLASSSTGLVPASLSESALAFTLSSLPLSLSGTMTTTMAKDQRDPTGSDLTLTQSALETLARITDGNFGQNSDPLKPDLGKQLGDEKGLSPLNILVSSSYSDTGQASPAAGPQGGLTGLQYRSAGSGGDTMLSAINYTDNEMLNDSAFDINNSAAPGLAQLDDNFLSGLGNPASGQAGNSFDLFDSGVSDPLSPFGDAGLSIDSTSLQAMDSERNSDSTVDDAKATGKIGGSKKSQQKESELGSPGKNTPAQCNTCGKQFNNYSALTKHRLTHSDERKYLCTICNKGFKRQDHLNGHQMTHLDKKPYQCPLENCDKGYCDARSLRRHLEAHHRLPTDVAQTHVLTSMAAAGIAPPSQRNGKGRAAEVAAVMAAAAAASKAGSTEPGPTQRIVNSPSYSTSSTPSPVNKSGGTGGSVTVKVDPNDPAELQKLRKLPETVLQQQSVLQAAVSSTNSEQGPQQFQVQFQMDQAPADILAVAAKPKKSKAERAVKALESPPSSSDTPGNDGGASQNESSWQERAQVYNFVGTPGSGDQSPVSVSGDTSPSMGVQVSPSPSPGVATPTSPLHSPQHSRLNWQAAAAAVHSDKHSDDSKGPVQCTVCERRFKTLPALNGHMRLHGGYMKKVPGGMTSPSTIQSPQQVAVATAGGGQVGDVQAALQFYVASPHQDLQQVGLHPLSQEVLQQHQQQILQRQMELQIHASVSSQMADQLKQEQDIRALARLKELEDIRSLEEQLKQNIHEHNLQQLTSMVPTSTAHGQAIPISLTQVNDALADVTRSLSPLRTASPRTQQAEDIQRLVEGFQQALAGLQLGQAQLLLQSPHIMQLGGTGSPSNPAVLNTASGAGSPVMPSAPAPVNPMTPGLPGGVLSNGQQLPLGSNPGVNLAATTEAQGAVTMQQSTLNPGPHGHLSTTSQQQESPALVATTTALPTLPASTPSQQFVALSQQQLGVSGVETLHMDVHDPAVSQLIGSMGGFEGGVGSELLQMSNSHPGAPGLAEALGQQSVSEKLPGFQSFQSLISTHGSLTPPSSGHMLLDSIKQDVMLSSAIHTAPLTLGVSTLPSDELIGSLDEPRSAHTKTSHSELKRRLSADLETSGSKRQHVSSLTHLLNKGPVLGHTSKTASGKDSESGSGANPLAVGGRIRVRSKSGDVHKFMRSKSVDHSLMRPRSSTEESVFRPRQRSGDGTFIGGRSKSHGEDYLSQSDGAGVFRNPSSLPSPFKIKRKHRPSPLFIPPYLSSFQSRLRSPRLWDGGDGKGRGHTPPPYTPPPMLSPIRSGSGLFWTIQSARPLTPQSAPVSARLPLGRRGSHTDIVADSVAKEDDESPPPETDIKPHVNVGPQFQADLPSFSGSRAEALKAPDKEDLMWEPTVMTVSTEEDVQSYQDFACCAAVRGNGSNVEYALHLLYLAKGDIQTAMLMLMGEPPQLPTGHGLLTYKYQESESWSAEQIEAFHRALIEHDKDFFNVAKMVGKSVKESIQFYYLWKKVCPDDYKRLRLLRRRRHQNALYSLRSQQPSSGGTEQTQAPQSEASINTAQDEFESDGSDTEPDEQGSANGPVIKTEPGQPDLAAEADMSSVASSPAAGAPPILHGKDVAPIPVYTQAAVPAVVPTPPPMALPSSPASVLTAAPPGVPSVPHHIQAPPAQTYSCDFPGCSSTLNSKQSLVRHMRKHLKDLNEGKSSQGSTPRAKPRPSTPSRSPVYDQHGEEIFPCKLCDRVFTKVKSRSAHMKSHKTAEPDKKSPASSAAFITPATTISPSD
ncbi:hypothetical protein BaRGS_00006004 [Batillaria attramentaria]|uniref:Uncharacterized protein n=1 Tax=Batillaria attramentaria TaxID=370345 RepID=A0ABD0LT66_9CAEN